MNSFRVKSLTMLVCLFCSVGAASLATAATLTSHPNEASFLAAVAGAGGTLTSNNFDGFAASTQITDQIPGVFFSSPNVEEEGYFPISAVATVAFRSPPNILAGGSVPGSQELDQIIVMNLSPSATALAFYLAAQDPTASPVTVRFTFNDESTQDLFIGDDDGNEDTPVFFGVTSDTQFFRVTLISGTEEEAGFEEFGIDDLMLQNDPPVCTGEPATLEGTPGVDGFAIDDGGIETVELDPDSVNLVLTEVFFGETSVSFRVEQAGEGGDAQGNVIVTDIAGLTCTLPVSFRELPDGGIENETVCEGDGILISATNPDVPGGTATCSSSEFTPSEPPLPPGYKTSPEGDPYPCTVGTVMSLIAGDTDVIIKKDGPFDPRLRLMASSSPDGGSTFPDFEDWTDLVEQIDQIVPDPTRVRGRKVKWSVVKLACAIQAEICDGVDNDGNGLIDEDLPVDEDPVDYDEDGFPLCPTMQQPAADCNDRRDFVYPGAPELCNGLDDDCDGDIDEGAPQGGEECVYPGQLGICADGITSCANGPIRCTQLVFPGEFPEHCTNGLDDDCDGLVDSEDPDCPLLVVLESFTADIEKHGVRLRWTTTTELDNVGFHVLRSFNGGEPRPLTQRLIPAQGSELMGADYEYFDVKARRPGVYEYYLVDVDTSGNSTQHGPVSVDIEPGRRPHPRGWPRRSRDIR